MGWTNWLCVPALGLRFEMSRHVTVDNYEFVKKHLDKINMEREDESEIIDYRVRTLTVGQLAQIVELAQISDALKDYGDYLVEYAMMWSLEKKGLTWHIHDGGSEKMNEQDEALKAIGMD